MGRIVVGTDGSDSAVHALQWALAEAERRGDEVHVIHAWQYPTTVVTMEGMIPPSVHVDFAKEAHDILDLAIENALAGAESRVPITREAKRAPAAMALIDASAHADLLVVGSRGRGGLAGLVLGSVGQQCATHAKCPVVILPLSAQAA